MGMLDGRVALVTGGSKGLGAATARLFAEAGARVVVTFANDPEAAEGLIASLPGTGHRASHTPAQDTGAIESLAATIGRTEGRLDILVNNAGSTRVIPHADLSALDDEFFDFVLAVNLRGPFATVRACRQLLEASGHGLVAGDPGRRRRPELDGDADDRDVDAAAARPADRQQPAQANRPARGGGRGDPRAGNDDDLCQRHGHPGRRRQPVVRAPKR